MDAMHPLVELVFDSLAEGRSPSRALSEIERTNDVGVARQLVALAFVLTDVQRLEVDVSLVIACAERVAKSVPTDLGLAARHVRVTSPLLRGMKSGSLGSAGLRGRQP